MFANFLILFLIYSLRFVTNSFPFTAVQKLLKSICHSYSQRFTPLFMVHGETIESTATLTESLNCYGMDPIPFCSLVVDTTSGICLMQTLSRPDHDQTVTPNTENAARRRDALARTWLAA